MWWRTSANVSRKWVPYWGGSNAETAGSKGCVDTWDRQRSAIAGAMSANSKVPTTNLLCISNSVGGNITSELRCIQPGKNSAPLISKSFHGDHYKLMGVTKVAELPVRRKLEMSRNFRPSRPITVRYRRASRVTGRLTADESQSSRRNWPIADRLPPPAEWNPPAYWKK